MVNHLPGGLVRLHSKVEALVLGSSLSLAFGAAPCIPELPVPQ